MNHTRTTGRGIIRCTTTAILTLAAPFGLTACSLFESMDTGTPDTSASGAFEETNTTETSTIGTSSMEGGTTTATPTPNQNTLPPNASDQYFIDLASEYLTTEQDYRQDNDNADALRTLMCDGGLAQLTFDLTAFSGIDAPNPNDPSSAFNEGDVRKPSASTDNLRTTNASELISRRSPTGYNSGQFLLRRKHHLRRPERNISVVSPAHRQWLNKKFFPRPEPRARYRDGAPGGRPPRTAWPIYVRISITHSITISLGVGKADHYAYALTTAGETINDKPLRLDEAAPREISVSGQAMAARL